MILQVFLVHTAQEVMYMLDKDAYIYLYKMKRGKLISSPAMTCLINLALAGFIKKLEHLFTI